MQPQILALRWLFLRPDFGSAPSVPRRLGLARFLLCLAAACVSLIGRADELLPVGVAQMDITPDYPVRLSGFGFRRTESEGVTQPIFAKALAFGSGAEGPAVLITADNLCVPDEVTREVARRLGAKARVKLERLTITATHTHTAPMLTKVAPTLFSVPIPEAHQASIDRYSREFTDKLEQVALAAIKSIRPARVSWGIGEVGFSINRRTKGGPVDHDLPVLVVRETDGKVRAVYFSYACHCVTLSNNKISGDWAGFAQAAVQKEYPGAVALASVGCGADSNPSSGVTGDKETVCADQGDQVAHEVKRLLDARMTALTNAPATRYTRVEIPFDTPRTRLEWEERAKKNDAVGYHARVNLERLDRGEALPTAMNYPIQSWLFGDQLAIVFLPGETVVDYSLRLKKEFDRARLWVNGYSNEGQCYVPGERVLKEGGYEGGEAMIYYDRPQRFAPGLEDKIIKAVHEQLPPVLRAPPGTEGTRALSPQEALRGFQLPKGLRIELAAAEPLVTSPVAIDWGADGRMWVCEMLDYPSGIDQGWQPGGRVRVLESTRRDGRYDKSTLFMENLPFPTGVMAWGRGVLVCAAPDILYAEDTDGDGKADKVEKLFSGFATENYQARVNGLSLGLDNWIYGANGLTSRAATNGAARVDLRNHDFRFRPLRGAMEPISGPTQQGRVRDDWGRWFGCDNSRALFCYPYEERYFRRNSKSPAPPPQFEPPGAFDIGRIYPISRPLERFNDPGQINRVTSGCGLGLYRDHLLGAEFYGNAFTCEPVHNLVHRMILDGEGAALRRSRAPGEEQSEFLASTDNWFRPVQARTGPDGALYVVDMHRFLIEHPRWIPAARLARLDVRAGADMGRVYRIVPEGQLLRPVRDLTAMDGPSLAGALDTVNGTERDRVHLELLFRGNTNSSGTATALEKLARNSALPAVRLQALCALEGLGVLRFEVLEAGLADQDPRVRREAVRLCEPFLAATGSGQPRGIQGRLIDLAADPSPLVLRQLAFTLGKGDLSRNSPALASLVIHHFEDPEIRQALLSSPGLQCGSILRLLLTDKLDDTARSEWMGPLTAAADAAGDTNMFPLVLSMLLPAAGQHVPADRVRLVASVLDAVDLRPDVVRERIAASTLGTGLQTRLTGFIASVKAKASDPRESSEARALAVRLHRHWRLEDEDVAWLCSVASGNPEAQVRAAAREVLRASAPGALAERLLLAWGKTLPGAREEILSFLLSREEWRAQLLSALRRAAILPNEISLPLRQQLLTSGSVENLQLAAEVFAGGSSKGREEIVREYAGRMPATGQASGGAEVFVKNCAACHAVAGVGNAVGPDLAALRNKEPDYWLKNILDPNAVVEPRFVNYQVELKDGRSLNGVITGETATSLTLAAGGGVRETIARTAVAEVRASALSLMPEGFEQAIQPAEMADLLAYLRSGSKARQFAGNTPGPVSAGADGVLMLPAAKAEIYGEAIAFEGEFKNLGMWSGRDDFAAWTVEARSAGDYEVQLDYACAGASASNNLVVAANGRILNFTVAATGSDWSRYQRVKVGSMPLVAGVNRITVQALGPVRGALLDLRTVALSPVGVAPKWPALPSPADQLARDPATIARIILDLDQSRETKEAVIGANPQFAADLIVELTRGLGDDTAEEYRRIPWVWRVALACGRRNDPAEVSRVLDVSVPVEGAPLRDWQAVVLGGGLINGLSQRGLWPEERVSELRRSNPAWSGRWERALDLAALMAEDDKVAPGTRYDALRMLGAGAWEKGAAVLRKHLRDKSNEEVQMGAVSALGDLRAPDAGRLLVESLPDLAGKNRALALDALLRTQERTQALLHVLRTGRLQMAALGENQVKALTNHPNLALRREAAELLQSK